MYVSTGKLPEVLPGTQVCIKIGNVMKDVSSTVSRYLQEYCWFINIHSDRD